MEETKKDWVECSLGDIAKWGSGGTPKSTNNEYYDGGDIPWLIIGDLNDGYVSNSEKKITKLGLQNSSAKLVKPNSILIAMYGSIGKLGINKIEVATNQAIAFTHSLYSGVYNLYLFYFLYYYRPALHFQGKGGTQKNISQTVLKKFPFLLPPLVEQKAIVKKIEELFSSLDIGISDLKKAQEQLKTYRQAVLKKAFEGELTKEWREKQTNLPSGDELLEQIEKERQKYYEQQLAEWKKEIKEWEKNGKKEKRPTRISKIKNYSKVREDEIKECSFIHSSWKWTRLGMVTYKIGDIDHKMPKTVQNGIPYISTGNILKDGSIDFENAKLISKKDYNRLSLKIKPEKGDIIFPRYGTIGRNVIVKSNRDFLVSYSCAIIKNIGKIINEKFTLYYSLSPIVKKEIKKYTVETTQANIGIASIENFIFPLCSLQEQKQIVQEIESRLSVCDSVEQNITESLEKAQALRQSILKKAFDGTLLSEEEIAQCKKHKDYEPASVLLEKIKAEKKKSNTKKKKQNVRLKHNIKNMESC